MDLSLDTEQFESRVRSLAPLVKRIAKHIAASVPNGVDQNRLAQAGMAGLIAAAKSYPGGAGPDFETYAVPRIRREIIESLQGSPAVSSDSRSGMRDVESAIARLEHEKRRTPTEKEVAHALGLGIDEYRSLLLGARGHLIVSYEDCGSIGEDAEAADPLKLLDDPALRETVIAAIDALPERERLVMSLYHEHQLNHAEIGAVIGLAEDRVSAMYTQAIARIRVAVRQRRLLS
jgi:RNA polymerase sigma factor FliA